MALTGEQIIKLKHMRGNGFTHQEIADELKISRKTVENHLRRLKQAYEPLHPLILNIMLRSEQQGRA